MHEILPYWPVIVGVLGFVGFIYRVESGMKANQTEIKALWRTRAEDQVAAREARETTHIILSEIRAEMRTGMSELRSDVKALLQRGAK